jgi:hypothetical protein
LHVATALHSVATWCAALHRGVGRSRTLTSRSRHSASISSTKRRTTLSAILGGSRRVLPPYR